MSDEELVSLVQKGEVKYFEEIIGRYEKKIYWYLKTLTSWDEMALEDMTQDTFIKTYRNIQGFDTHKRFSSWIYAIAHNVGVDFLKKQKHTSVSVDELEEVLLSRQDLVEELAIAQETKQKLQVALSSLSPKDRDVLTLYYFEDKSYDEIGEILRIPPGNVGVLLFRIKKKLRLYFNKHYGE